MKQTFLQIGFFVGCFGLSAQTAFAEPEQAAARALPEPVFQFNYAIVFFCLFLAAIGVVLYNVSQHLLFKQMENMGAQEMLKKRGKNKNRSSYRGGASNDFMQHQQIHNDFIHQQQMEEDMRRMQEEGFKSVTPFDMGGYVQGPGFNPSDTMAHEAATHNMDMGGMNNMGGMGMM